MKALFFLKYNRNQANSRVRGFYIADELKNKGVNCGIICGFRKYFSWPYRFSKSEIIYFQSCYFDIDIKLNQFARAKGKPTIFDIDDAPSGVSLSADKLGRATEMMKRSCTVVVGSHKLMEFAQDYNKRSYLVPSSINLDYYAPKQKSDTDDYITLGWIGYGVNYKNDLLSLIGALDELAKSYKIKLIIVGAQAQREIHNGFASVKSFKTEIIDSLNWADPYAVPQQISRFDIGLYPLLDKEYNRYKCGFKTLEYMAMGVPVIASPVAENSYIIEDKKDGILASTQEEWQRGIAYLIENKQTREDFGRSGRKKIEEKYSTAISADKLINIFKEI